MTETDTRSGETEEAVRDHETGIDLWRVVTAPTVWAAHFLVCYVGAAVVCAKTGRDAPLGAARDLVGWTTVVALALLAVQFWSLWRARGLSVSGGDLVFEHNSPEERHRFLCHVALMLTVLSVIGVLYVALPAFLLETCR